MRDAEIRGGSADAAAGEVLKLTDEEILNLYHFAQNEAAREADWRGITAMNEERGAVTSDYLALMRSLESRRPASRPTEEEQCCQQLVGIERAAQNMSKVSCAVCAVCSDRGISRPSRREGDEEGETALFSPPYLDPAMAVQWSLDGEVTPL